MVIEANKRKDFSKLDNSKNNNDSILLIVNKLKKLDTPSKELGRICRAVNERSFGQKIFSQHPNLRQAAYKLINLLTIYWPDPKNPGCGRLIDRCFSDALRNCKDIYFRDDPRAAIDLEITFIKSIYDVLSDVFKTKLMVNSNYSWRPHDLWGDPLIDVINKQEVDGLIWTYDYSDVIPYGYKIVIASKVFSIKELNQAGLVE